MGEEQVLHENTLYAEPVFHVGQFPITNSMINSWLVVIIVVTLAWSLKGKINKVPRGLQNALEMVFEDFFGIFDSVTGNRKKTLQFAPFVLAFFFFILINIKIEKYPNRLYSTPLSRTIKIPASAGFFAG